MRERNNQSDIFAINSKKYYYYQESDFLSHRGHRINISYETVSRLI